MKYIGTSWVPGNSETQMIRAMKEAVGEAQRYAPYKPLLIEHVTYVRVPGTLGFTNVTVFFSDGER